jgi:uncharacterized protein YbaR (Trm112 family)
MDKNDTNPVNGRNLGLSEGLLAILVCPIDHGKLEVKENGLHCSTCGREYPVEHGIPHLVVDHTPET